MATPTDPELWEQKTEDPVARPVRDKKIFGLKASERNVLLTLPADIVALFLEDGLIDSNDDEDFLPDLQTIPATTKTATFQRQFQPITRHCC